MNHRWKRSWIIVERDCESSVKEILVLVPRCDPSQLHQTKADLSGLLVQHCSDKTEEQSEEKGKKEYMVPLKQEMISNDKQTCRKWKQQHAEVSSIVQQCLWSWARTLLFSRPTNVGFMTTTTIPDVSLVGALRYYPGAVLFCVLTLCRMCVCVCVCVRVCPLYAVAGSAVWARW